MTRMTPRQAFVATLAVQGDALRQAVASDRAKILDIMPTQELGDRFRRDALNKPVRLLDRCRDYTVA